MKTILYFFTLVCLLTGCTKDLTKLNRDPKNPTEAASYTFVTNAQRRLTNTIASSNQNMNVFRLIAQHWQQTQYTEESNYDLSSRNVYDNLWDAMYRDVLMDLEEAKRLIPEDVADQKVQQNQLAIVDMLQVYSFFYLVTTFGDIPYSEALDVKLPFPKYDDSKTIFNDLLTRLDTDIAALDNSAASFASADIIYSGNVDKWKKFGNSLKLKMAMTIADVDATKAKSLAEAAVAGGVLTSAADNAMFRYLSSPPNTNQIWVDLVQSTRDDYVAASTLVNTLIDLNDPRLDNYFTTDASGGYSGGEPGEGTAYSAVSHVHPTITAPDFPGDLLDYAEIELLLAEAVERGCNVGGTAKEHYDKGVTASVIFWNGTPAEAATYLTNPEINYSTAGSSWQQKIGLQKWIANYNRGWDAWLDWRRLDAPHLDPAANAVSEIPVRLPYPIMEQNVNRSNYEKASGAIGGDDVETKLFWDKF
jgi:hypothetical protein